MRATGRIEDVDAALVSLCRVAADQLDEATADREESRYTRGVLVARYHGVLSHLLARPDSDDADHIDDLFAALSDIT